MPKKLKIKIDGVVSMGDIPVDVEELELDCRIIEEGALEICENLKSITLINTEVICKEAFRGCRRLKKIRFPETLREIGDRAFTSTDIYHLIVPPSVVKLGSEVIADAYFYQTMTIYLKDGKTAPFFDGSRHNVYSPLWLIARSLETEKILYRFMVFHYLEETLTEHGIDFTKHDELMMIEDGDGYNYFDEAARARLKHPVNMTAEAIEQLKDRVSGITFDRLGHLIWFYDPDERYELIKLKKYANSSFIRLKPLIELIGECDYPEITEILTQLLYKKLDKEDIGIAELAEAAEMSARLGLTEITAVLMQKLYERGGKNSPKLEL